MDRKLTNLERFEKIKTAQDLIREVEFSYEVESEQRKSIYREFMILGSPLQLLLNRLNKMKTLNPE